LRAALPEVDLVQIGLENFALAVAELDEQGHHGFIRLAFEGAFGCEEEVLDELLGERAATLSDAARAQVREQRSTDASNVDAGMRLEALILDGDDGIDEVRREVFEAHQFALRPIGSVVGAQLLRFDQHRTQGAASGQLENFFDETLANPKHDVACGLGSRRVLEGPKVDAHAMFLPRVLSLLNGPVAAGFPVSEPHEAAPQICEFHFQARVDDGRCGVDARRNAKSLPLEALPHDSIESNHDEATREARNEADRHPKPGQLPKPAARAPGRAAPRFRTALRSRAALARSRFTLSRVGQRSPGGIPSGGRNRDRATNSGAPSIVTARRVRPHSLDDYPVGELAMRLRRAS
jgi:hypothetical protein